MLLRPVMIATLTFAVVGAAASVGGVSGTPLAAGAAPVAACDPDGFTLASATAGGRVTSVTVGGIKDPGCEGGALAVELTAGGAGAGGGGPVSVAVDADSVDNAVTLAISPQPLAHEVDGFSASVVGP